MVYQQPMRVIVAGATGNLGRALIPVLLLSVGGPADLTWNEIAELAGRVAEKNCIIRHWPKLLLRATLAVSRLISRPTYGTLSFLGHVMTNDTTAPNNGSRNLEEFFRGFAEG